MILGLNFDYYFWTVALGTCLLAVTASMIGSFLVLNKQSQLADAMGHSVFPGIIITFMIFQSRNPLLLLAGACLTGWLALHLIQYIKKKTTYTHESILALILSSFFGLGLVLSSYIQGNVHYQKASQAGLQTYIMGQAAYLMTDDVWTIFILSLIILIIFFCFYPQIKHTLFDPIFAQSIGINVQAIQYLVLVMAIIIISIGLKAVGAILVASMLIAPCVAAQQWSHQYARVLIISSIFAFLSAFIGTFVSTQFKNIATGPSIILCLTLFTLGSFLLGPNAFNLLHLSRKEA